MMNKPGEDGTSFGRESVTRYLKKRAPLLAFLGTLAYMNTPEHHQVLQHANGDYYHTDPPTNHILQYLSGKEKLTPEERTRLHLAYVKSEIRDGKKADVTLPDNFDDMTMDQIKQWMLELDELKNKAEIETYVQSLFDEIPEQRTVSPDLYSELWELEKRTNAPKIRWTFDYSSLLSDSRAHYSPRSNTIAVLPADEIGSTPYHDFVSEASHAIQFQNAPYEARLRGVVSIIRTGIRVVLGKMPIDKRHLNRAYNEEYTLPGSIEQQAHEEIEVDLRNQYPALKEAGIGKEPITIPEPEPLPELGLPEFLWELDPSNPDNNPESVSGPEHESAPQHYPKLGACPSEIKAP